MSLGYDATLPSKEPFMWIEAEVNLPNSSGKTLRAISFGAYNAMGLIGPEMGGVAIVCEDEPKGVIAVKTIPYDAEARTKEINRLEEWANEEMSGQDWVAGLLEFQYIVR